MAGSLLLVFMGFFVLWLLASGKENALSNFIGDIVG